MEIYMQDQFYTQTCLYLTLIFEPEYMPMLLVWIYLETKRIDIW